MTRISKFREPSIFFTYKVYKNTLILLKRILIAKILHIHLKMYYLNNVFVYIQRKKPQLIAQLRLLISIILSL